MPPFSKLPSNFPANSPLRISGLTFDLGNALMAGMHLDHTQSSSRVTQNEMRIDPNEFKCAGTQPITSTIRDYKCRPESEAISTA